MPGKSAAISGALVVWYCRWLAQKVVHEKLDWRMCFASRKGIRIPKSWALESGIPLKESGIPLTIRIQNPSSTDKETRIQYLESGIDSVESRIQDCLRFRYMGQCLCWGQKPILVRFKMKTKLEDFWTSWVQAEPSNKTLDSLLPLQQGTLEYWPKPLFQTRLSAKPLIFNDMKLIFHFHANTTHFHTMKKGFAFGAAHARQHRNPCLGPQLWTRIWVRATVSLSKLPLSIY